MPLLVLCGQPASGKSTLATKLVQLIEQAGHTAHVVDEPSLHLERNHSYSTTVQEKNTRAALKSTVERVISHNTVVILDSLNNIKGYRYELWCIARAAGTHYGMVHVDTPMDLCRQWNQAREASSSYSDEVFTDLSGRFERPDARNRWDAPLFTVQPGNPDAAAEMQEVLQAAVAAMTGAKPAGNAAGSATRLQPTNATTNPALLGTNVLHDIDQAAQDVINRISEAQTTSGGAAGVIDMGTEGGGRLELHHAVSLAELRRIKRAFIKLATKVTFARIQDAATARRMFVDYLREQLAGQPT